MVRLPGFPVKELKNGVHPEFISTASATSVAEART
jgi:hypothetical protein